MICGRHSRNLFRLLSIPDISAVHTLGTRFLAHSHQSPDSHAALPAGSFVPHAKWNLGDHADVTEDYAQFLQRDVTPAMWRYYNSIVWPPGYRDENGEPKVPELFHVREDVKYSPRKMFFICELIQGLSIDDALKQLEFVERKGAEIMKEILLEAQTKAVKEHFFEYRSNMWVSVAFSRKSRVLRSMRRAKGGQMQVLQHRYINVYVTLEEGSPSEPHKRERRENGWEKAQLYLDWLRSRRIENAL